MSTSVSLGLMKVLRPYMPGTIGQCVKAFEEHLPGTPVIVMGCGSECLPVRQSMRARVASSRDRSTPGRAGGSPPCACRRDLLSAPHPVRVPPHRRRRHRRARLLVISASVALNIWPQSWQSRAQASPATGDQTVHFTARELDVLAALQRPIEQVDREPPQSFGEHGQGSYRTHHAQAERHEPNASGDLLTNPVGEPSRSRRGPSSASRVPESGL